MDIKLYDVINIDSSFTDNTFYTKDAIEFYSISKSNLGEEWLNNKWSRIGASSLANSLLTEIHKLETGEEKEIKYF